jgi:hypothetical protein
MSRNQSLERSRKVTDPDLEGSAEGRKREGKRWEFGSQARCSSGDDGGGARCPAYHYRQSGSQIAGNVKIKIGEKFRNSAAGADGC